jgi:hypothetical protein
MNPDLATLEHIRHNLTMTLDGIDAVAELTAMNHDAMSGCQIAGTAFALQCLAQHGQRLNEDIELLIDKMRKQDDKQEDQIHAPRL